MLSDGRPSLPPERSAGLLQAWRNGLVLADALDRFAGGRRWSECNSRIMGQFDHLHTDPRNPLSERVEATVRLQDMARDWEKQERLLEHVRTQLIDQLRVSTLLGLGFIRETTASSKLTIVPPEAWTDVSVIDWERSRIASKTMQFMDVRILPSP